MRKLRWAYLFILILVPFLTIEVEAQRSALQIIYAVKLTDPASQQFHITTDIKNISQPQLNLSLPTWTPGWYTVENYAKNLLRFRITANGKVVSHAMSRKQTWTVDTRGIKEIRIDYDYRATVLALNQAKITKDFAFFTGTQLFLQPEGHRDEPSTVQFSIPSGWKIVTALKETNDPTVFTAPNYEVLVDSPVELGNFDLTRFEVEGKPHYFVANPAGSFSKDNTEKFVGMLAKVAATDSATWGGLPYEKYVYFYFFSPAESNANGALEHMNSHVSFVQRSIAAQPEQMIGTASHEFFHLWNVKRIRPAEMWPYDYSRENETPLLWVSEGFTTYYGGVALYRAGLMTSDAFVRRAADAASSMENSEARQYISPAASSVSTWIGYDTPTAFGISYYTQGQNLAALLDLSIRQDTNGSSSLDDVMRALYEEHYKRNRGFTAEDMIRIISRLAKKDYHDFFRKYVFWTDVPEYDRIFGFAGYKLETKIEQAPVFGAGLERGDVIVKIDGRAVETVPFNTLAGKAINATVRRDGREVDVPIILGTREVQRYQLTSVAQPSAQQLKIREGWLKR